MSKQIHIRLNNTVNEALPDYSVEYNSTTQDSITMDISSS